MKRAIIQVVGGGRPAIITHEDVEPDYAQAEADRLAIHVAKYPDTINKLKFKRRLVNLNQWVSVRAFLAADQDLWDEFLISDTLVFGDSLTIAIATNQGWTQEQLKQLFRDSR